MYVLLFVNVHNDVAARSVRGGYNKQLVPIMHFVCMIRDT